MINPLLQLQIHKILFASGTTTFTETDFLLIYVVLCTKTLFISGFYKIETTPSYLTDSSHTLFPAISFCGFCPLGVPNLFDVGNISVSSRCTVVNYALYGLLMMGQGRLMDIACERIIMHISSMILPICTFIKI